VLAGAKTPAPAEATQEFTDQKAADVAYLELKTDLGLYAAGYLGLTALDVLREAGQAFMQTRPPQFTGP